MTLNCSDKTQVLKALIASVEADITVALEAARVAQEAASHEDNQPENQYDTLSLEAAYLAHGQSERIFTLQQQCNQLRRWQPPLLNAAGSIHLGALVTLISAQDQPMVVFITPCAGRRLMLDTGVVLVVNEAAPLAQALKGMQCDEDVELTLQGQRQWWTIDSVV